MKRLLMSAAVATLLSISPAAAQSDTTSTENSRVAIEQMSKVTAAQDFVNFAALSDIFEIQTGQMAAEQAGSQEVMQFGAQLAKDHGESSRQLMELARQAKLQTAPPALDQRHQVIVDSLKDAKGPGFDTAFLQAQVEAHQEGVALFRAYSENGDNAELKAFASKGLPILQAHLEMAQKLAGTTQSQ